MTKSKTASGISQSVLQERASAVAEAGLARLTQAEQMLAEIATAEDAVTLVRFAEAARVYAKEARLGTNAVNHATVIKIRAECRLADVVDGGQAAGEIATAGGDRTHSPDSGESPTTLQDLGIMPQRVEEARLLRGAYSDGDLQAARDEADRQDKALSRDRLLRKARDAKAAGNREVRANQTQAAKAEDPDITIVHGDFRTALDFIEDATVDAVITDPPYPAEFLPLYADLAVLADRVLKPEGLMAVLIGQTHLPVALDFLNSGRPYRWMAAYLTPGAGYVSHARRVQSNWKPLLIFGKGRRFGDVISSTGDDKRLHPWGQDFEAFHDIVERLTEPRHLIVDPFLGAGTTAAAAKALGRRFIGCDSDQAAVDSARERVA